MIKKLTTTLLIAATAIIGITQPGKIPFEKYNVAEGLPEEFVRSLIQDDKGFIWFGTQNGLVKYDGYRFEVFRPSPNNTDTASFRLRNLGGGLLKTRDGRIWIGDSGGDGDLAYFDPATETFRHFNINGNKGKYSDEGTNRLLFEDQEGDIWFKWRQGSNPYFTFRLNPVNGRIKQYPLVDIGGGSNYLKEYNTIESSGTIWMLDDKKNLNKLNRQKDRFEIIIPAGTNLMNSGITDTLRWLAAGAGSNDPLILSGSHGIYIFDAKKLKIIKSYVYERGNPKSLPDSVLAGMQLGNGQIWASHPKGQFSLIDPVSGRIEIHTYGSGSIPYQKGINKLQNFRPLLQDRNGMWFYAMSDTINFPRKPLFIYYQFAGKKFTLYDYNFNLSSNPLPARTNYISLQDRTGLLWLATRPGLYKQAPKKHQMNLYRYRADDPTGLPTDTINYLFEDSKKRLWVGTSNGLALYQPGEDHFSVFRNDPSKNASLSNNIVTTIFEDGEGIIWVGTRNGLNQWQESSRSFKRLFYSATEINGIPFLFADKQQRLWLSIFDKGVFVLEKGSGRILKSFIPDPKNPASLTSKQIFSFYQDSKGSIWLGDPGENQYGLYKLNPAENGFTHYKPVPGDSTSISSDEIRFIGEDGKQRLWIGTDGGLNLYNQGQNKFTRFTNVQLSSVGFMATDKQGNPWFGTYSSGGLVTVDPGKGTITAYDESKGLLHNDLNPGLNGRMAKDEFGRLWLPTQRGLSVFVPETRSFVSYFEKDGFQPYGRSYTVISTKNGDIWIGGNNGLNRIVPKELLKKDTTLPSIVLTQVTINDAVYSKPDGAIFKQSVAYTKAIELKYWQKDLSFDFVALHFLRSEDNLYSWKLENYDKGWTAPSRERKASYTNLSPGKYIFRVKASNADGVWNEEGISFTVTILPPWWLTWWAYTIYALLFLFGLRVFSLWRERRLRQEKETLQVKVEERTTELKKSLEDLKATQSQLIQSEKMASLGELTAGIAHEIQNPLNFVNNFSDVNRELADELEHELDNGNYSDAKAIAKDIKENEEKIIYHGKRADTIVKNMLLHSRGGSGVKEPTDINAMADEYLRLSFHGMRARDKSFHAKYETHFDPDMGNINIVQQDISRVLLNLINNAFYAVSEKAKENIKGYEPLVIVSTNRTGDKVSISVKDNGNGIPDSIKEKIFQPFFTTKPTGEGTGLGLSLSYDIIKAHGGLLLLQSTVNAGSTFTIQLPIEKVS